MGSEQAEPDEWTQAILDGDVDVLAPAVEVEPVLPVRRVSGNPYIDSEDSDPEDSDPEDTEPIVLTGQVQAHGGWGNLPVDGDGSL